MYGARCHTSFVGIDKRRHFVTFVVYNPPPAMKERPLMLLSNDDGFSAPGLAFLVDVLRPLGDLIVCAPDTARSGMSAAITATVPLRMRLISEEPGLTIYKTNGTPVDCVKLALNYLFKDRKPDAMFSGINHGTNASVAIHYSGTLGAVIEACINDIPAVGLSLDSHTWNADFEPSRPLIRCLAEQVLSKGLPRGSCLNVNIPNTSDLKGLRLCRQARGRWVEEFDERKHPRGDHYYWLTGNFYNDEPESEDTDMHAMKEGYVAVVPSCIDMTDYRLMQQMQGWDLK